MDFLQPYILIMIDILFRGLVISVFFIRENDQDSPPDPI